MEHWTWSERGYRLSPEHIVLERYGLSTTYVQSVALASTPRIFVSKFTADPRMEHRTSSKSDSCRSAPHSHSQ
eukprot:3456586-Pyramimonas_sp.AAC.1